MSAAGSGGALATPFAGRLTRPIQAVVLGGLVAGALDIAYAMTFWGVQGVSPMRILQSIAAGLLGRPAAVQGGLATALLGAVLHFGIAFAMAYAYYLASGRIPALTRRPFVYGMLYGLFLYVVMNYVVVPLSAAGGSSGFNLAWVLCSIAVHAIFVGIPCALAARLARRLETTAA